MGAGGVGIDRRARLRLSTMDAGALGELGRFAVRERAWFSRRGRRRVEPSL